MKIFPEPYKRYFVLWMRKAMGPLFIDPCPEFEMRTWTVKEVLATANRYRRQGCDCFIETRVERNHHFYTVDLMTDGVYGVGIVSLKEFEKLLD